MVAPEPSLTQRKRRLSVIREEKSMQIDPRNLSQRRFSTSAAALVIVALILGSVGAASVLATSLRDAPVGAHRDGASPEIFRGASGDAHNVTS
ncbi:hypothetical protein [Bosea sp. (in: a-proteobacteria)]|uniref:hypothetical protein n=1 Tax=Bosea sp. (in: a-proteobacteria) TaxID=1871050 RepID=UPI003F7146A7